MPEMNAVPLGATLGIMIAVEVHAASTEGGWQCNNRIAENLG